MPHKHRKKGHASHPHEKIGTLLQLPFFKAVFYPAFLADQLDICRDTFRTQQLPPALDGLTIAFASDIHYGKFLNEERVHALAQTLNDLRPDVLVLGGDYGEDSAGALRFWALHPGFHAESAAVGVLGNHDRAYPAGNLEKNLHAMRENGVTPLCNDVLFIEKEGQTLALAGIDDYYNGDPDITKTAALCRNADFTVFISHTPDVLPGIQKPFFQLALCGHTHGGQVSVLGHALHSSSDYGSKYLSGWYTINGAPAFVTNGVGTSSLPVRLGARPQVHLITLKKK